MKSHQHSGHYTDIYQDCLRDIAKVQVEGKETKPVNPKGNQPQIVTGRTDAEAEASVLWPPDVKRQLTEKDPHAGKD